MSSTHAAKARSVETRYGRQEYEMTYQVAERFKSVQGEGIYAGTPMAFIRFVGCSVGKKICHHCDTDFDKTYGWKGGGTYAIPDLIRWAWPVRHWCLTGGEPFDQELHPIIHECEAVGTLPHVETSGTVERPDWVPPQKDTILPLWVTVSPKPGWREEWIDRADEIKVIVPGLGTDESVIRMLNTGTGSTTETLRWPTLQDALQWAASGKIVYLQPRNAKLDINQENLRLCEELVQQHPSLRLSVQLHKVLRSR